MADICGAASIHLCIEPVPRVAGGKFYHHYRDSRVRSRVKHKYLKMNLDIAVLHGESQHFQRLLTRCSIPLDTCMPASLTCRLCRPICDHKGAGAVLRSNQFSGVVAIEMLTAKRTCTEILRLHSPSSQKHMVESAIRTALLGFGYWGPN